MIVATDEIDRDWEVRRFNEFDMHDTTSTPTGTYLDVDSEPAVIGEAELLACGVTATGDVIEECHYKSYVDSPLSDGSIINLYAQTYAVTVLELHTGRVVDVVETEATACPPTYRQGVQNESLVATVSPLIFDNLLVEFTAGNAS